MARGFGAVAAVLLLCPTAWGQSAPDPGRKYRVFLDTGSALEGTLRFTGDTAVVTTSIGRVTLQRRRVEGFADPATGVKYDWRDFVAAKPAEKTDAPAPAPRPAPPVDPAVAAAEKALLEWADRGFTETVRFADDLKECTDAPAEYLAANLPRLGGRAWHPASRALIEFGDTSVFPDLRRHLKSPEPDLRVAALSALIRLGAPLEDFIGLIRDVDERVRLEALKGVEGVRVPDYVMVVPDLLLDESRDVRRKALEILCRKAAEFKIEDPAASRVADLLAEATPAQRTTLMQALGTLGSGDVVDAIASYVDSEDPLEAADACAALAKINHADARAALREALRAAADQDRSGHAVRLIEAVEAQMDVRATPILVEFFDHDDDLVAERAHKALGTISGLRGLPKAAEPWMQWYQSRKLPETEPEKPEPKEKP